jgi:DNA invertase Pin-like site-specific DNA recombinase|tara:strand:- start:32 stop:745 length:714 start_codon:yes stop_codon:yes gene_type:complete
MTKSIGYARTSTNRQSGGVEAQVLALKEAGCSVVFQEQVSTRVKEKARPQLQAALGSLESGDELVVTKLDRLGRTQVEVVSRLHDLQEQSIHVRTLDGLVNTKGLGKFAPVLIGLLSGLAEVERSLIQERTMESIQYRRATGGNLGGRPKTNTEKERLVIRLRKEGCSYRSIRNQTGLGQATIRRIIVDQSSIELPIKRELVLRLHSEGLSNTQIHRETDIGLMLISKIIEEQEVMA